MAPGQSIGPYRIVERKGAGGMGVVYEAFDSRLNRKLAIKALNSEATADPSRRQRFLQEAQSASALDHPNIVTIYDILEINGQCFIVMQYVEGKTLGELLQRGPLRTHDALRDAVQIADALAQAHSRGIVHRDLKPDNVMITPEGQVKVLDFGLAKLMPANDSEDAQTVTFGRPQTLEGQIVGTAGYMSPEQAQGKKVDSRTDVFSFGAMLYEMTTGQRAFPGANRMSVLAAIIRDEPRRVSDVVPSVAPELERIITRALRKDPERRWQSMADLRVALMELKEETESGAAMAAAPTARSNRRLWFATAGLALVAVGLGAWRLSGPGAAFQPPMRTSPLTGGLNREGEPAFSPDGKQIAYIASESEFGRPHIYVKLIGAGDPLQLTNAAAGVDHSPAWSPDGRYIAFERLSGESKDICLVPSLGGPERRLATLPFRRSANRGLSWSPDGKQLAATAAAWDHNDGIVLLSAETGEQKMIAKPPDPYFGYSGPVFSPDGKSLAFIAKRNGRSFEVALQQIGSDHPRMLTSEERVLFDLTWAPDGRSILFCSNRSGVAALWRVPVGGGPPERVAGVGENATHPTVPPQGGRLAYVQDINDTNIWRAALDENHKTHDPVRIVASSRDDRHARYSPDGTRIVFVSERSGAPEIWIADAAGGNPRVITSFGGAFAADPRFSPDGRQIAFDMPVEGYRQIFVIGADGGPPRRLTNDPSNLFYPTWSRDGKWLYYFDTAHRPMRLSRIPSGGGPKVPISGDGGTLGMESPDGKFLYYVKRPQPSALWRMPLPAGPETQVDSSAMELGWDVGPDGVYLLRPEGNVDFLSFNGGKLARAAEGLGDQHHDVHEISVSPDGRWLLYTRHDRLESTIQVVEGFR